MLHSNLSEELISLKAENAWLNTSLDVAKSEIEQLKQSISVLQKYFFGKGSEKTLYINPKQQELLFNEAEANAPLLIDQQGDDNNHSLAVEETLKVVERDSSDTETRGRKPLSKKYQENE